MARAGTLIRKMITDPRSFYYYCQKAVRHPVMRDLLAKLIAMFLPSQRAIGNSGVSEWVMPLQRDGFVFLPDLLTPAQMEEIRKYLLPLDCMDMQKKDTAYYRISEGVPEKCRKLGYSHEVLAQCPHFLEIANHPKVIGTVAKVLGCKPTISSLRGWWSFPGGLDRNPQVYQDDMFHRDVDDFRFIKLFIYLTDVSPENGPHVFIKGSHNDAHWVKRGPIPDDGVQKYFGNDKFITFTAPAGTVFLENTWGIHRGSPLKSGSRLILQVLYTLTGCVPERPSKPVSRELPPGADPYINRVYITSG
jgi:hypothetical protein